MLLWIAFENESILQRLQKSSDPWLECDQRISALAACTTVVSNYSMTNGSTISLILYGIAFIIIWIIEILDKRIISKSIQKHKPISRFLAPPILFLALVSLYNPIILLPKCLQYSWKIMRNKVIKNIAGLSNKPKIVLICQPCFVLMIRNCTHGKSMC